MKQLAKCFPQSRIFSQACRKQTSTLLPSNSFFQAVCVLFQPSVFTVAGVYYWSTFSASSRNMP